MAEVGTVFVSVMPSTKGFTKALGGAGGSGGSVAGKMFNTSFGKIVGGSAIGNIISSAFGKITGTIAGSMGAAISRVDTIANFPKVMQNLGYGSDAAKKSIDRLSAGIDGMPTSLDGIVSMTQQLAPMCGGLEDATTLSLAMNNMFLASGASTADQARAMQQYSQMLARGKVELNDWRTLQEVMPGQLNQVAQAMLGAGKNSTDLYNALKTGKVKMTDFNKAVIKLNSEGMNGFASFEEQARASTEGIGTAMENMKNRVSKAIAKVLDHIGQGTISGVINNFTSQFSNAADIVIAVFDGIVSKIDFAGFEAAFGGISNALSEVFGQGNSAQSFGEGVGEAINLLIPIIQAATPVIQFLANALKFCADNASWLIPTLIILAISLGVMKAASNFAPNIQTLSGALGKFGPVCQTSAKQMLSMAAVAIALGAGILLACLGVYLLVQAALQIVDAGPMAALALLGLVAVIAVFAVGAAMLGPALTAGAVGMLAFGVAILLVGIGIAIVIAAFALLCSQLPIIAIFGTQAAFAILMLGMAMLVFGAGAIVAGLGSMIAGVGLVLLGVGALVAMAGIMALSIALMMAAMALGLAGAAIGVIAAAMSAFAAAVVTSASGATDIATAMGAIAGSAPGAAAGLGAFAAAAGASAVGIGAVTPVIGAFAAAATAAGAGVGAIASGIVLASAGALALAMALLLCVATTQSMQSQTVGATAAMGSSMSSFADMAKASMLSVVAAVMIAAARIRATKLQAKVEFALGPMPHFSMSGKFDAATGAVPWIDVNWYAKGGIFKKPSVIGISEAGTEVVENVNRLDGRIRKAVRAESDSNRSPTQNFNIYTNDPELVAAKVAARQRRAH